MKRLPHIAWAYAAHAWTTLVRLWALPFVIIGWVVGVVCSAVALGWEVAFEFPLGKWALDLRQAHQPKPVKSARVGVDDDDFDSFDDED